MRKQKIHGITLIALIITIIVLLILAGVSISMVVGDNGVLGQAINASTATDIADTKEQIELEIIGKLDENGEYTVATVLEVAKEITGNDVDTSSKTVESAKGNTVDISDILDGAVISWYYDDDGNVTNGLVTLAIGDTVYYNAATGATETSYTSYTTKNGYSDQTFTLSDSDDDYEWQVMGADEDTGELLIVLSYNSSTGYNYIKTDAGSYYYLTGQDGYVNCVTELDNICSLFGQGYGATGARSMTIEDVNKLTGYDPETAGYGSGYVYEYGNEVTYTLEDSGVSWMGTNKVSGSSTSYSRFNFFTNGAWTSLNLGENTILTSDYYYYTKSNYSTNSSVVFPGIDRYWLASQCVMCKEGWVHFSCRYVYTSVVTGSELYHTGGGSKSYGGGVRATVSLSSAVSLSSSSLEGWSIVTE